MCTPYTNTKSCEINATVQKPLNYTENTKSIKASTDKNIVPVTDVVSEKTLSSCDTAAYLSWALPLLTGGVV